MKEAFLYQLVAVLKDQMGSFPEIVKQEKLVTEVIKEEENSFLKTIEHGLVRLDAIIQATIKITRKTFRVNKYSSYTILSDSRLTFHVLSLKKRTEYR